MAHWLAEERVSATVADTCGMPWRGLWWALRVVLIVEGLYAVAGEIARIL